MKKTYRKPCIYLSVIANDNILALSGGNEDGDHEQLTKQTQESNMWEFMEE